MKKNGSLLDIKSELEHVEKASTINLPTLTNELKEVRSNLQLVQRELDFYKNSPSSDRSFTSSMSVRRQYVPTGALISDMDIGVLQS